MQYLPARLLWPLMTKLVASGRGDKKPSLQLDLARGRRQSEVRYLNGAVSAKAAGLMIETPVNTAIVETLLGLVEGRLSWDEYRRRPEELIASIHR
jgi:2-dehydropantoate 2-reductase